MLFERSKLSCKSTNTFRERTSRRERSQWSGGIQKLLKNNNGINERSQRKSGDKRVEERRWEAQQIFYGSTFLIFCLNSVWAWFDEHHFFAEWHRTWNEWYKRFCDLAKWFIHQIQWRVFKILSDWDVEVGRFVPTPIDQMASGQCTIFNIRDIGSFIDVSSLSTLHFDGFLTRVSFSLACTTLILFTFVVTTSCNLCWCFTVFMFARGIHFRLTSFDCSSKPKFAAREISEPPQPTTQRNTEFVSKRFCHKKSFELLLFWVKLSTTTVCWKLLDVFLHRKFLELPAEFRKFCVQTPIFSYARNE